MKIQSSNLNLLYFCKVKKIPIFRFLLFCRLFCYFTGFLKKLTEILKVPLKPFLVLKRFFFKFNEYFKKKTEKAEILI